MQLENLIKELIFTNDCVTIPDFGSFIANRFPSLYNKEESKFYPPSRRITFNSKIKNNDGLLANFISTENNISYDQALKKIHEQVVKWKRIISKEPLVLKDLGELSFNKDENLVFKPDLDSNHFLESFGLAPIYVSKIERKTHTYNNESLRKYNELSQGKPGSKIIQPLRLAAVFFALIAGTFFIENKYNDIIFNNEISFQNEVRNKSINKLDKAIFDFGVLPAVEFTIPKQTYNKYHIIAGAFRLESNADNLINSLANKGYNPSKLPINEKGLIPVSFDNFSNRKDAVIALRKFQNSDNKDAWIFDVE